MRTPGWLGVILALLIALVAGGIGFAAGTASTMPTDTAAVHATWGFPSWGFPFVPLFFLLFLLLVVGLVARGTRRVGWSGGGPGGPWGWGGHGPWSWGPGDPRRQAFEEWHRHAHGEPAAAPPQAQAPHWQPTGRPSFAAPPVGQPPYGPPPGGDRSAR